MPRPTLCPTSCSCRLAHSQQEIGVGCHESAMGMAAGLPVSVGLRAMANLDQLLSHAWALATADQFPPDTHRHVCRRCPAEGTR